MFRQQDFKWLISPIESSHLSYSLLIIQLSHLKRCTRKSNIYPIPLVLTHLLCYSSLCKHACTFPPFSSFQLRGKPYTTGDPCHPSHYPGSCTNTYQSPSYP